MLKYKIIKQFIRQNKCYFASALVTGIISSICTVLLSLGIGKFYEIYFNDTGNKSRIMQLIGIDFGNSLFTFFMFYTIVLLLKGITEWTFYFFSKVSAERLSLSLRNRLFTKLLFTQPEVFAKKAPGKYLLRFSGDLQAIQNFLTKGVILFLKDIFFLLIGCWFLMKTDYSLALVVFLYIPLLPAINYFFSRALKTIIITRRNQKSELLAFVSDRFFNMVPLKVFRKEGIEKKRFKKKSSKLYKTSIQYHRRYAYVQALTSILLYSLPAVLLFLVAIQEIQISKGHLMAFMLLIFMQLSALKRIGKIQTIWQAGITSLNKITQLLHYPAENRNIRRELIEFSSLELSKQLNGHNLIIKSVVKGTINIITHPDTDLIIKLILGIMPDTNEEITLNGCSLKKYSAAELRCIVGVSSNHINLYGNTIYESAVIGRTENKEKLFTEILYKLGYKSNDPNITAGEKLSALNFQQRKLVSIARAVLTNAPLLIFDNPFEGFDKITQNKCYTYFNSLLPEKTIIILNSIPENIITDNTLSNSIKDRVN